MPLPDNALTIHGGCNCRAIRYRIQVPDLAHRPLNPFSDGKVPFPMIATDHCNDCRRANGSILPTWMCVPAEMLSISLRSAPPTEVFKVEDNDGPWQPALEVLHAPPAELAKSTLRVYGSSAKRTRSFCGHCGTIDREDLEKEWMAPDRHCWWEKGIPWVQELATGGLELPKHPTFKVNEFIE